jgi:hypothetical protein
MNCQASPKRTIPSNWLKPTNKEVDRWSSLVRIPSSPANNVVNERRGEKEESGGPEEIWTPDPRHVKAVS